MMAFLDYFIEIIFFFFFLEFNRLERLKLIKKKQKKLGGGRGEDIHFHWTSKNYRSLCVSPRTRYNHLDAAQVFLFPFVTGVC